ncbi:LysR family transcriptional regulator [Glaciecola siphonariae]|uniref:LysR family transcriptional regulator n=1 Tax=Glaciecola siphonariae TaxID=521012 RepID=A0ABV9LS53_9ALTE
MNIESQKLFLLVFRNASFAAVAKQLDMSPSSVSRAIANLEDSLSTRLFHRSTRVLKPTQAGIDYYQRVFPLIEEMDKLHHSMKFGGELVSGPLRISASTTFAQHALTDIFTSFCERYPKVELDLTLSDTRLNLIENQIDVAIRHGNLPDSNLVARKLLDVRYFLVASPNYIKKMGDIMSPEDLEYHHLITFNYSDFNKQWHFSEGSSTKSVLIKPKIQVTNAGMIRNFVLNSMGIGLLADWTVLNDIENGKLLHVLPNYDASGDNRHTSIWVMQPSRAYAPKQVSLFIEFLFSRFQ